MTLKTEVVDFNVTLGRVENRSKSGRVCQENLEKEERGRQKNVFKVGVNKLNTCWSGKEGCG